MSAGAQKKDGKFDYFKYMMHSARKLHEKEMQRLKDQQDREASVIAVIGPHLAGRLAVSFALECKRVEQELQKHRDKFGVDPKNITLVSGASSECDHIAVRLFNEGKVGHLDLYLPCDWDMDNGGFVSRSDSDKSTVKTLMASHELFSVRGRFNSIAEIQKAILSDNCTYSVYENFHARNDAIAKHATRVIAFSNLDDEPDTPGTAYTWKQFPADKRTCISIRQIALDALNSQQ